MMIKEILFKITLNGNGVAQRDTSEQKWLYAKSENCGKIDGLGNDNISLGKANFYKNPNYNAETNPKPYVRKLKISSAGLKHSIHREYIPFYTPAIFMNDVTSRNFITKSDVLLRGYMHAPTKEQNLKTIKKASAYSITDAEISNNVVSNIEARSTSGERNDKSFFFEESVGETEYKCRGFVDLESMSFLPTDNRADRICMYEEDKSPIVENLKKIYGEDSVEVGFYHKTFSEDILYEEGVILSNKIVNELVKDLFNKIANIFIGSKNCFAKTSKIEIKLVSDPVNDFGDDNYVTIYDVGCKVNTINEISFERENFYKAVDLEIVKAGIEAQAISDKSSTDKKSKK